MANIASAADIAAADAARDAETTRLAKQYVGRDALRKAQSCLATLNMAAKTGRTVEAFTEVLDALAILLPMIQKPDQIDQRERFEQACYAHYLARHAAGKTPDSQEPAGTREQLLWRQANGEYGVLMFNASWWAWQEALK